MQEILFTVFSALGISAVAAVVFSRNAVNSAMFMILAFVATAGMFVMLNAYFLGILQVLVYAGAVMVLFLFIIMLLNVAETAKKRPDAGSLIFSIVGLGIVVVGVVYLFAYSGELPGVNMVAEADLGKEMGFASGAKEFGYLLFTKYMLPFQVAGFLLLMAMVGVIVISKGNPADKKQ